MSICDATTLDKIVRPSTTTAAAVSSHDDSIPRIFTPLLVWPLIVIDLNPLKRFALAPAPQRSPLLGLDRIQSQLENLRVPFKIRIRSKNFPSLPVCHGAEQHIHHAGCHALCVACIPQFCCLYVVLRCDLDVWERIHDLPQVLELLPSLDARQQFLPDYPKNLYRAPLNCRVER